MGRYLGAWGGLIRDLAHGDPARFDEVAGWPLPDALLALWGQALERALEQHRYQTLSWQIGGAGDPPELPEVLRDE